MSESLNDNELIDIGVYQIFEEEISNPQEIGMKGAKCDSQECVKLAVGKLALYLCYMCNNYMCGECLNNHDEAHEIVSVKSEAMEKERMAKLFVEKMRSKRTEEVEFNTEVVRLYDQINVKVELDGEDCGISGICGLENKRWAVVDRFNYCVKIFSSVTNTLLKYVRLGSRPWDVTEIKTVSVFSDLDSTSDVCETTQGYLEKHCLIAITLPRIKQIWIVDVNNNPAMKTKSIDTENECLAIDCTEDKIYTLCRRYVESPYAVYVFCTDGNRLKVLGPRSGIFADDIVDLSILDGKIYVTFYQKKSVCCIDIESENVVSQRTLHESRPAGLSKDPRNKNLYMCSWDNDKVYKMSYDLYEIKPLGVDTDLIKEPGGLCFTDGKLFIGHWQLSTSRNLVTVVQIT